MIQEVSLSTEISNDCAKDQITKTYLRWSPYHQIQLKNYNR